MKLFDLSQQQEREIRRLVVWHLGYFLAIVVFFSVIYYFGYFKAHRFLREGPIFTILAPLCTAAFILVSPWRGSWRRALENTYARLEGEPAFCLMGGLVFLFGFYIYSILLWALGALGPSIFYM